MLNSAKWICAALRGPVGKYSFSRNFRTSIRKAVYEIEPDYLKYLKPQVPVYERLNLQIKGYDFTVLEHFAKYAHRTALHMKIEVENAWATPHQGLKVTNIEPITKKVINEYQLNLYERNIQITNLHAYSAPLYFEILRSSLPEGISITVHHHQPEHDIIRYVPDFELLDLKDQLNELTTEFGIKLEK